MSRIFAAALQRPPQLRGTYVAEACAGDAALRADVESLLASGADPTPLDLPAPADSALRVLNAPVGIGSHIGVFRIDALLGVGGMGEVYRARDTKLNRDVAIKILPPQFANDAERLARFKREAQVLASLNHPNIAGIYGFEDAGTVHAIVMELVEGPTLADLLAPGSRLQAPGVADVTHARRVSSSGPKPEGRSQKPRAMPVSDALAIAGQVANALEAAHEQGIVHRDLKPANIKVRDDGTVKVLDFGLAKFAEPVGAGLQAGPTATQSPTRLRQGYGEAADSPAMTAAGVVLGTAAYMSPEQAKGRPADKRSDIWAFGCIVYEMLTGDRPFKGDDVADTLAGILKSEPDWHALEGSVPQSIGRVLRGCLAKDPRQRYHHIADARIDLERTIEPEPVSVGAVPLGRGVERLVLGLLVVGLAAAFAYVSRRTPPASPAAVRFDVAAPAQAVFGTTIGPGAGLSGASISPDGKRLAFVATAGSDPARIWVRPLDSTIARPLADTENGMMPFWSPDSQSIAFFSGNTLKRVDIGSGTVRVITQTNDGPRGASWSPRGVIVFASGNPVSSLALVGAAGGAATPLPVGGDQAFLAAQPLWPSFLPDGRHFIYWTRQLSSGAPGEPGLNLGSIEPGERSRPLVVSDSNGMVLPSGVLLFTRGGALVQQPFDLERLEVTGEARPANETVFVNPGAGLADFSVTSEGALVFQGAAALPNQFAWLDRGGRVLETVGARGNYRSPSLAPDGRRLAYESYDELGQGDIWILDLDRKAASRFTSGRDFEACPVWFPDGRKIAYRNSTGAVLERETNGTEPERRLMEARINGPSQVSPDGRWLLYFAFTSGDNLDVYVAPTTGTPTPQAIVQSPFADVEPQFSPNGRWVAYASRETGRNEIYVQPFPPTGQRWRISTEGGRQPMWRSDGRELFFVADDRRFYAVDVSTAAGFDYGIPHFLFEMRANVFNSRNSYVPGADGKRFLVNTIVDSAQAPLTVALNWRPQ